MLILGIESSCDETAAAVLEDGRRVRSSVVASQDEIHAVYGGVVPELASRQHISAILPVIDLALERAGVTIAEIDGIAVTRGPGLIGSLLVGLSTAKAIGFARKIPWVGVDHIEGHLAAAFLTDTGVIYPAIGLVVSGGHTSLYRVPSAGVYDVIGQTRDDAAGEAFDKVAKLLGLGYPGGPAVDRISQTGDPAAYDFPRPRSTGLDFSFSGLKTSVAQWVQKHGVPTGAALADVTASFQEAVIDTLLRQTLLALDGEPDVRDLAVCGGVARNHRFRSRLEEEAKRNQLRLHLAAPEFCTDNAAMIAAAGYLRLARGERDDLTLNAEATIPLHARAS